MSIGRVFIVDDDASVLKALARLLRSADFEVSAFQSPEEFLSQHDMTTPGCAVFDIGLGKYNGLDLLLSLSQGGGHMRPTIFITGQSDIATSVRAMKCGAVDFLTKPVHDTDLIAAVKKAVQRDRDDREEGAKLAAVADRLAKLTPKESEVLTRVIAGRLNKQIAAELGISEKTVKVHRGRLMAKMGVRSVADLVRTVESALYNVSIGGPLPNRLRTEEQETVY